ncbi:hypothetical protein DCS32_05780 [Dokdonia sp. Dokd-P16]|uniref:hypothetical protein n=1 Tax=Dokdonia sp. Dokd-P16 TaxID=2173169 RepID=UPI000D5465F5|nr:hypothetical protein [Dokdonia sp. Dokd-P16]AWH73682.1 hypothetical protein DCS32_05780 [Dokdonia sp. Dokd-P16]
MPRRDLTHQNSKEASYYGVLMVVSFLVHLALKRVKALDNDLPDFLLGFTVALFIASSILTIIKYFKARKEPQSPKLAKVRIFVIIAVIFWLFFLVNLSKEVLEVFSQLA